MQWKLFGNLRSIKDDVSEIISYLEDYTRKESISYREMRFTAVIR